MRTTTGLHEGYRILLLTTFLHSIGQDDSSFVVWQPFRAITYPEIPQVTTQHSRVSQWPCSDPVLQGGLPGT